jgi:hypothetical protein
MRKLIIATTIAAATLVTWSASANAYTHYRAKPHATYRVNPMTVARLKLATARLAVATYQLRYRMNHRHVQTRSRVRFAVPRSVLVRAWGRRQLRLRLMVASPDEPFALRARWRADAWRPPNRLSPRRRAR